MSRSLAEALASRGHEVSVIVPRRGDQRPHEQIAGVEIFSFSPFNVLEARRLLRNSNAQVFHSQDPTFLTALAQWMRPEAVHVVTCRDPRDTHDWLVEFRDATWERRLKIPLNWMLESSPVVARAVRHAHGVYTPAYFLQDKVRRMYRPESDVGFLPNLIEVPCQLAPKPESPVLTFIGRLDRRKRPERFLELAPRFPDFRFKIVGKAESEARDLELRQRYGSQPNVEWEGYLDRFAEPERMRAVLAETWVLVNTASREGLPISFMEAAGYGCAIVSAVDPDGFASRFGVPVADDDFEKALAGFLADVGAVREAGNAARGYIQSLYESSKATDTHIQAYRSLIAGKGK